VSSIDEPSTTYLLDEAYATLLKSRFGERLASGRPELWPIAIEPERAAQRAWINELLSSLPLRDQRNMRGRIEKNSSFLATYNELALGALLRQLGYQLSYEEAINHQDGRAVTPDWMIENDGRVLAVFEITTQFRTDAERAADRRWAELKDRVDELPYPFVVLVRPMHDRWVTPDGGTAKHLTSAVADWLGRPTRTVGDVIVVSDEYYFDVLGVAPGLRTMLAPPPAGGAFDADTVLGTISEKTIRRRT
jgi:hypothetical protein